MLRNVPTWRYCAAMTMSKAHPAEVAATVAVRELRWLRRHMPETRPACVVIERAVKRAAKRLQDQAVVVPEDSHHAPANHAA